MSDRDNQTTIPIPPLTEDQKEYIDRIHKAGRVESDDPRLQEPIGPRTTRWHRLWLLVGYVLRDPYNVEENRKMAARLWPE